MELAGKYSVKAGSAICVAKVFRIKTKITVSQKLKQG